MSSDVLGLALEDVDVEEQIMSVLATSQSPDAVVDDLEAIVEDQEEALRRVDEELLIRDKFDLSKETGISSISSRRVLLIRSVTTTSNISSEPSVKSSVEGSKTFVPVPPKTVMLCLI